MKPVYAFIRRQCPGIGHFVAIYDRADKKKWKWVADVGPYATIAERDAVKIDITETGMILIDGVPNTPTLHLTRDYLKDA